MTLRGQGDQPLRPDPNDKKLVEVISEGILCQVLDEGMYVGDKAGMSAIVQEDNLNAAIEMGTGEMEVHLCSVLKYSPMAACELSMYLHHTSPFAPSQKLSS